MKINELSQYGDYTTPLLHLYEMVGNHAKDGYLGESLEDVLFDGEGNLHFSTHKEIEEGIVDSNGVVLGQNVMIKQTHKGHDFTSHVIYYWDVEKGMYTFLSFDNPMSMNRFFEVTGRFDANLCSEDISHLFQEMGLSFESVTQILLRQKYNPLDKMFEEEEQHSSGITI